MQGAGHHDMKDGARLCGSMARPGSAWVLRVCATAIASWLACAPTVARATETAAASSASPWTVVAIAHDTGCVVLDDGTSRLRRCEGERLDPPGVVLSSVEPGFAVFLIELGAGAPLAVRATVGQRLDLEAQRDALRRATGATPGWIAVPPEPRQQERDTDPP
jgi:hypothetical protein